MISPKNKKLAQLCMSRLVSDEAIHAALLLSYRIEHDMGNIFTALMGNATRIMGTPGLDFDVIEKVEKICSATQRGMDLSRHLDLFRASAYSNPIDSVFNAMDVAKDASSSVRKPPVFSSGREPIVHLLDDTGGKSALDFQCDRSHSIVAAAAALVENAYEAMIDSPKGDINVRAGEAEIVEADAAALLCDKEWGPCLGDCVYVAVEDCGAGIAESVAARMFLPAFSGKLRSPGFGLSDAYGTVCRLYGGAFGVWSGAGGSMVAIFVPKRARK